MQKVTIQIPVSKDLKISAEAAALEYGFSSLQEILRVIMKKLSLRSISLNFQEESIVRLSKKNERRYMRMSEDFKKGRNVYKASSVPELMKQLHGNLPS